MLAVALLLMVGENIGEPAAGAAVDVAVATATDHVDVSRMPVMITDEDVTDGDNDRQELWVATDNRAECKQCGNKKCCEPNKCKLATYHGGKFWSCTHDPGQHYMLMDM